MATPGLKDCDREHPPLRPFLPRSNSPAVSDSWPGHVRHSFAAALGLTEIPSVHFVSCSFRVFNPGCEQAAISPAFRALAKL